jgi:hypothetical protein
VPLAELISTQLLKGAEMPLEDLYAPRMQRLLEFSWNGLGTEKNQNESKRVDKPFTVSYCFNLQNKRGVL